MAASVAQAPVKWEKRRMRRLISLFRFGNPRMPLLVDLGLGERGGTTRILLI